MRELIIKLDNIEKLLLQQNILRKQVLNITEAALYLGISKSHLYKLTSSGQIPHYKPGGKLVFFNREELDNWALSQKVEAERDLDTLAENYLISKPFKL